MLDGGIPAPCSTGRITTGTATTPRSTAWIGETRARLAQWGFNSAGAWSLPPQELKLPSIINLELGRNAQIPLVRSVRPGHGPDHGREGARLTAPYRATPTASAISRDNEVGWWGGALFTFYSRKARGELHQAAPGRRLLRELLPRAIGGALPSDFVPPAGVHSWNALLREPGDDASSGPAARARDSCALWTAIVAEHYYALSRARASTQADPDALYFGDRLPIYYDPAAIRGRGALCRRDRHQLQCRQPRGLDRALLLRRACARLTGAKPVLISEWFYAAHREPHRQPQQRPSHDGGHASRAGIAARRRRRANFAAIPELAGAALVPVLRLSGGRARRTARITISAWSISTTGPMRNCDRGARRGQPRSAAPSTRAARAMPRQRPRALSCCPRPRSTRSMPR